MDSKNYHCWVYRKWLCEIFDLYEEEKKEVELFLDSDSMNNSAWSYRFYLYNRGEMRGSKDKEFINREIEYVRKRLEVEPKNESAWNYLNG